jgi:hypothetical protein
MSQQRNNITNEDDDEIVMWGNYIRTLDVGGQDEDVLNGINGAATGSGGSAGVTADVDVSCVTTTSKGAEHSNSTLHAYVESAPNWPRGAPGSMNQGSSSSMIRALSLRQWIKHATVASGSNGHSSPAYVSSAMKIAFAITKGMADAENLYTTYHIPVKLDTMPLSAAH